MRRFMILALLVVGFAATAVAQTSMTPAMQNAPARKSPLADYAGAWVGTFEGHTWMTVRLTQQGTSMSGTVRHQNDVKFSDTGDIKSVGDEQVSGSVESAVLNGDSLMLTVKNTGSQETERYVLRLTSANIAEMKMVAMSMPPGMPKLKPWMLSRVGPSAVTPVR